MSGQWAYMLQAYSTKVKRLYAFHAQAPWRRGGWGGAIAPPVFVAKIYKLIKLKAKVVNILKILTSDLYRRCMRHIVRVIRHANLICSLGRRHFQPTKVMLMALWESKFAVDFVTAVIALLN